MISTWILLASMGLCWCTTEECGKAFLLAQRKSSGRASLLLTIWLAKHLAAVNLWNLSMYCLDLSSYHICTMLNTAQEDYRQKLLCGEKVNRLQEGYAGESALSQGNFPPFSVLLHSLVFCSFLLCISSHSSISVSLHSITVPAQHRFFCNSAFGFWSLSIETWEGK